MKGSMKLIAFGLLFLSYPGIVFPEDHEQHDQLALHSAGIDSDDVHVLSAQDQENFDDVDKEKDLVMAVKNNNKISHEILSTMLANHGVLLFQTLNYHWNIVGPEFHDYHLLFDKQYNQLFANLDLIAERARAVGSQALGSMKDFLAHSTLKEDQQVPEPKKMVTNLLKQYEIIIEHLQESHRQLESKTRDIGTIKMIEDLLEQHEKTAWMLRSLLGK